MDYMETNEPCYGADAKPGNYKMECLQQIFLASGGTNSGTGYPGTKEAAQVLLVDEAGIGRSLDKIGVFLYKKMVTASTGMSDGQKVAMKDWDEASMFMTGKSKAGPCDTEDGVPLSTDCLSSLYMSSGCLPKGKLNPDPAAGNQMNADIAAAMSMGGAEGKATVSKVYAKVKADADVTGVNNVNRKKAYMDCYGIPILQTSLNLALYVSVDGPGHIQMSQLVVKDANGVNVAKGGDTSRTAGGTYSLAGGNPSPNVAVDGTEAPRPFPNVYHSASVNNPWFTVQLTKPSIISEIIYYGRSDCCPERNKKYIKIWDQAGQNMWVSPLMTTENIQKFTIPMSIFEKPPVKLAGRVSVDGPYNLNISQLVVKDINGVNVAKGGDTSLTTGGTSSYPNAPPSNAVDGTEMARPHPQIYHSNFQDNPWFIVTLTKPSIIKQIVYYGRAGCCPERHQRTIKIWDNVTGQLLWASPTMTKDIVQTFNIPDSVFQA
jgi:hypothetical protein